MSQILFSPCDELGSSSTLIEKGNEVLLVQSPQDLDGSEMFLDGMDSQKPLLFVF
jgi:hypothetical protein